MLTEAGVAPFIVYPTGPTTIDFNVTDLTGNSSPHKIEPVVMKQTVAALARIAGFAIVQTRVYCNPSRIATDWPRGVAGSQSRQTTLTGTCQKRLLPIHPKGVTAHGGASADRGLSAAAQQQWGAFVADS